MDRATFCFKGSYLGRGTPIESKIRGALEQVQQAQRRQPAPAAARAGAARVNQAFNSRGGKPVYSTVSSGGWGGRSAWVVIGVILVRGIVAFTSFNSHSGTPTPSYPAAPTYNTPSYNSPQPYGSGYSNPPYYRTAPDGSVVHFDPEHPGLRPSRTPPPWMAPPPSPSAQSVPPPRGHR